MTTTFYVVAAFNMLCLYAELFWFKRKYLILLSATTTVGLLIFWSFNLHP